MSVYGEIADLEATIQNRTAKVVGNYARKQARGMRKFLPFFGLSITTVVYIAIKIAFIILSAYLANASVAQSKTYQLADPDLREALYEELNGVPDEAH